MNVTISAFFNGTNHNTSHKNTLAYLLKAHVDTTNQKAFAFEGCGEEFGTSGALFGGGLDEQCQRLINAVELEIQSGNRVTLNVYGLSRGAVAALMLAKQLGSINPDLLEINLALIDPVPGNLITTSTYLDPLDISLANKTMDLRECKTLNRVLALYPYIPLPADSFHAPLLALYPEHTEVEEDVIAGCHAGAQYQDYDENTFTLNFSPASFISFTRVYQFFKDCGTWFKPFPISRIGTDLVDGIPFEIDEQLNNILLHVYENQNNLLNSGHEATNRETHSLTGMSIQSKERAEYFNLHHQRLLNVPEDKTTVRLTIEEDQGLFSKLKRATVNYPKTCQAIKWSVISIAIASLMVFTGGLGALPLIGGAIATSGMICVAVLAPLVAIIAAGLWYGAVKPMLEWIANKIYYPEFKIREFQDVEELVSQNESTTLMASSLGLRKHGQLRLTDIPEQSNYSRIYERKSLDLNNHIIVDSSDEPRDKFSC